MDRPDAAGVIRLITVEGSTMKVTLTDGTYCQTRGGPEAALLAAAAMSGQTVRVWLTGDGIAKATVRPHHIVPTDEDDD